ncbi:MAG: hypothetical protein V2I33_26435 [Kangiellaceae bacterium]|jgi:hypothetical protein|nr:hypothetical protein [Kangiellaceae bacterium]
MFEAGKECVLIEEEDDPPEINIVIGGEEENEQRHQVSLGEADDEAVPEQMLLGESEVRHEVMSEDVVESSGNALRCQVVSQDGVLVGDVVLESGVIDDADDVSAPTKKRVFVEVDAARLLDVKLPSGQRCRGQPRRCGKSLNVKFGKKSWRIVIRVLMIQCVIYVSKMSQRNPLCLDSPLFNGWNVQRTAGGGATKFVIRVVMTTFACFVVFNVT